MNVCKSVVGIIVAMFLSLSGIWLYIGQPTIRKNTPSRFRADEARLRTHVETLSTVLSPRSYTNVENLGRCAEYISKHFAAAGADTELQEFVVEGKKYFNVVGRFGGDGGRRIIVGAHYDAYQGTPGADDNASGTAGLIELAYLIGRDGPGKGIDLVAYSLEEPPFFRTDKMGSAFHAASLKAPAMVEGVIVLESIGYFNDRWGSQFYPMILLNMFYPARADFIAVVGRTDQRGFTKKVKAGMKGATDLPVYSINAPAFVPGVDFSDHRNYWPYGINAVMITDTAFYRNPNYHMPGDTPDKLDYSRMSKVVAGVFEAIRKL